MSKVVCYVGGGASSIISAIILKRHCLDDDVVVFESNKPLQKLKMTGNGKCNIAPLEDDVSKYNNPIFVKSLFEEIPLDKYLEVLLELGIETKAIKDYGYYPISESAPNVASILLSLCDRLGIRIINDTVIRYQKTKEGYKLFCKNNNFFANYIVFGVGSIAHLKDDNASQILKMLNKLGYGITPVEPSLCPIKVKEDVRSLFGVREDVSLSLYEGKKLIKKEEGELQFKKDGLSGICIMNLSKYIKRSEIHTIKVDFMHNREAHFNKEKTVKEYLLSIVKLPLAIYVIKNLKLRDNELLNEKTFNKINTYLSNLTFNVKGLYPINEAQVAKGGINSSEINKNFSSRREENIYFMGEMLDIDAECGGYNLRFAITSGIVVALTLIKM